MRKGNLHQIVTQTLADLRITSTREADDGPCVVRIDHDALVGEPPIYLTPDGADGLATRICVAGEMANKGVEGAPFLHGPDGEDLQCMIEVEAFSGGDSLSAGVEINLGNFQIRMCARGAVRFASRLAFAAELARQEICHEITEYCMTNRMLKSAYTKLMAEGTRLLLKGKNHFQGGKHDLSN